MRRTAWVRLGVVVSVMALVAAACGDDDGDGAATDGPAPEGALRVPQDHDTIQDAVDAAEPGDLVYVDTGTYREAVTIQTENVVLRGADRNETIIDAEFEHENCVFIPETDGVVVENLTVTNCTGNGVYFSGADGYRVSYVNSIRAGDYGIYAFDSMNGQFDNSYASGSADAGYYIGQCDPCNAVISNVVAEWNGLGYSGTNAGGDLYIVDSTWRDNRAGIVPNSLTSQQYHPQREVVMAGNVVYDNNNEASAAIDIAETAIGTGILIAGGTDNVIEHNLVEDHETAGIALIPLPESILYEDREDGMDFAAIGNEVLDNVVTGSGVWDLVLLSSLDPSETGDNCFSGNEAAVTGPPDLQELLPCGEPATGDFEAPLGEFAAILEADQPPGRDYRDVDLPDYRGENMPDADSAPAQPATPDNVPMSVDVTAIATPTSRE